jgi:hypothetical protein
LPIGIFGIQNDNERNDIMNDNSDMSEHMKNSMRSGLIGIGVIVVVGLALWLGYEIYYLKGELARGMSWMSGFV